MPKIKINSYQVTSNLKNMLHTILLFPIFSSSLTPSKAKAFPLKQFKKSQMEDLWLTLLMIFPVVVVVLNITKNLIVGFLN